MNKKKSALLMMLCASSAAVVLSVNWTPPPPPPPPPSSNFEQNPPIVQSIWAQKLEQPINNNTLEIQIQYANAQALEQIQQLPLQLPVYLGQNSITLYDDGTNGDAVPMDGIFTGTSPEDPQNFANDMQSETDAITTQVQQGTPFFNFAGHLGTQIPASQVSQQITFSTSSFMAGALTALSPMIFTAAAFALVPSPCVAPAILEQNSLFITDLSVVEDPARTYNVATGVGNPVGAWTFNTLITNMANGGSAANLLLSWFTNYTNAVSACGTIINPRPNFVANVIAPWLVKCGTVPNVAAVTPANWIALWNATPVGTLMKNAPFKLTAIVNRLDLRGNPGYGGGVNAGETRFIYTLIDPNPADNVWNGGLGTNGFFLGAPPLQIGNEFGGGVNFEDWRGMNVIFEYGNTQTNFCATVNFANQWVNLSTIPLGNPGFNPALEAITNTVTAANAAPAKPNGSAINRIRTNERINDIGSPTSIPAWEQSDWEFRQFELTLPGGGLPNPPFLFAQACLTNTPVNSANTINNTTAVIGAVNTDIDFPLFPIAPPNIPFTLADQNNLMNWIFDPTGGGNIAGILAGNFSIPATWSSLPLLSGGKRVDFEYLHYEDLNWASTDPNFNAYVAGPPAHPVAGNTNYKLIRQQISVNSCDGCHAGETKTMFTHVVPMAYGTSANYWGAIPDNTSGQIDERFVKKHNALNYPAPPNPEFVDNVSAFLTGRTFRNQTPNFADDFVNPPEDLTDPTLNGLFYVNAPDNYATNPIGLNTYLFGYNDLLRRKYDLGQIACTNCGMFSTSALLRILVGQPLPLGGH